MQSLDYRVVTQALEWLEEGRTVWLCTVLSTFGSSPREPGSLMVANDENRAHCQQLLEAMRSGELEIVRQIRLTDGVSWLEKAQTKGPRVVINEREETVCIRVGALSKLILAGYSSVAEACAGFAISLGYQVVICDPREEVTANAQLPEGAVLEAVLPSLYISAEGACTASTAVVATTHDPKIDDLAMMAAVKTPAAYIGVMGSMKTSRARAERLSRTGGLSQDEINRIHMPIGLHLGSKTPAEIALAIMADIVRVRRGRDLNEL
ncbi:MAG: XdhC family protein [Marinobacter sp.]|nr:XdhC family protein [Marinobacter sp.]